MLLKTINYLKKYEKIAKLIAFSWIDFVNIKIKYYCLKTLSTINKIPQKNQVVKSFKKSDSKMKLSTKITNDKLKGNALR